MKSDLNPINPAGASPSSGASSAKEAASQATTKLRYAAVVLAGLIVIGTAAGLLPRGWHSRKIQETTRELGVQTVSVLSPVPGQAPAGICLPAEIAPFADAPIYARTSGYVIRYFVDIGDRVKEGDLLAEIDTPDLNQELMQAKAQLAQARATLGLAQTTAARWAELLKTGGVSRQDADSKAADLELQSANVEAAKANVHRLEDLQSFQRITAPFSGTITARKVDVGHLITAGSGAELFHLAQTTPLRVFVRVPQTLAMSVATGQVAELLIPEIPSRIFQAKVVRTAGAISTDSRTLLTEMEIDNAHGEILPGCFAQVRLPQIKREAAITIPANALLFRAEGPQVGVVGKDGTVELRTVGMGRDFGKTIEILTGITLADRIIVNPPDSLVSGMTVQINPAPVSPPTK